MIKEDIMKVIIAGGRTFKKKCYMIFKFLKPTERKLLSNIKNWYLDEDWEQPSTGIKGTSYISKEDNKDSVQQFEIGKCLIKLTGSFCWKGIWEGRLYFNDEEYWGEDIQELSNLYNNHIVNWCKQYIKQRKPNNSYDE